MEVIQKDNQESNNNQGFAKMMGEMREVFDTGRTLPVEYRQHQLDQLLSLIEENFEDMLAAVYKDMKKMKMEGASFELEILKNEIKGIRRDLKKWEKRDTMPFNFLLPFDTAFVKRDPFGLVLIIGAWNYPFLLALQPLIGAIAGGNCAIVKPSENAPHAAAKMSELIPKYLDTDCYRVVLGDATKTIQLLEEKFDYIFATSSTKIGKSIMQAAAKNLTPVTLELGGKSPVYIDEDADLTIATKRILWGKCINLGQTCIAPDYILCTKSVQNTFIEMAKKVLKEWYGDDPKGNPDLIRIINANHFKRLSKLLDETSGKVVHGGDRDSEELWISPTLVVDVKESDSLMQEELFGPILPFITVKTKEEAMKFIKDRPKPLALYVFATAPKTLDYFIDNSSSGAVCCNDVVVQNGWEGLPFGGVGDAGMGRYHGKYSYDAFTHPKSVVVRNFSKAGEAMTSVRYPPYSVRNMRIIATFMKHLHRFNVKKGRPMAYLVSFVLGAVTSMAFVFKSIGFNKQRST